MVWRKTLDAECHESKKKIKRCGGIDCKCSALARRGTIGFNELHYGFALAHPSPKASADHSQAERRIFRGSGPCAAPRHHHGVGTILDCRRCILLATGAGKAEVIAKAVEGPITSMISATPRYNCTHTAPWWSMKKPPGKLQAADYYPVDF